MEQIKILMLCYQQTVVNINKQQVEPLNSAFRHTREFYGKFHSFIDFNVRVVICEFVIVIFNRMFYIYKQCFQIQYNSCTFAVFFFLKL